MTNLKNIQNILNADGANLACLLDLLAEHPAVRASATLTGATSAIKTQYLAMWEKLETASE